MTVITDAINSSRHSAAQAAAAPNTTNAKQLVMLDLDDTVLSGDSDYLWGLYLIKHRLVDEKTYYAKHLQFKRAYTAGKLDMAAYVEFSAQPLREHPSAKLMALRSQFTRKVLLPLCRDELLSIMWAAQTAGKTVMIITATQRFVVEALCSILPVTTFLATELEQLNGCYTGKLRGVPSFREGKWTRLQEWLQQHPEHTLDGSVFVSDSYNDRFLLEKVEHPIVVSGKTRDETLLTYAGKRGWEILYVDGTSAAALDNA